ncbi:TetR family transcriptional regulator [Streptomyces xanthochromogenes]|uniref:TetR/AcrR family transcriptional regulator n=1 Tax=Streptomyces xanthochromogenes TaxID=67384 RepID=UPI00199BACF8|nr:TetR/AcrR family transcriptional regulator [Streptomyces xanthochromogenes]GHB36490.1 TetR family transcriptional regulator [Streptomyces xanthochromogenes]
MTPEPQRPLRADAERNRQLIMRTAERLIARRGPAVTLNEIARAAGVGVGTVYRRFPDLQALIDALFTERFTTFLRLAAAAGQHVDPAQALRQYLLDAAQWRSEDRALDTILAHAGTDTKPIARMRDELGRHVDGLVRAAVTAGAVREDFASADVYAFLHMIGAVADRTHDIAPGAWRRYAEVLLLGFGLQRSPAAHTSAMTEEQIRRTWPEPATRRSADPGRAGRA